MQKYIKDIFDEKCIYIYANVYHFVAYMSRSPGEGGVGSRPHPLPQSPPGDREKRVWARKRLANFLFKFTSSGSS